MSHNLTFSGRPERPLYGHEIELPCVANWPVGNANRTAAIGVQWLGRVSIDATPPTTLMSHALCSKIIAPDIARAAHDTFYTDQGPVFSVENEIAAMPKQAYPIP